MGAHLGTHAADYNALIRSVTRTKASRASKHRFRRRRRRRRLPRTHVNWVLCAKMDVRQARYGACGGQHVPPRAAHRCEMRDAMLRTNGSTETFVRVYSSVELV